MKAFNQSITLNWEAHQPLTVSTIEDKLASLFSNNETLLQWVITDKKNNTLYLDLMLIKP